MTISPGDGGGRGRARASYPRRARKGGKGISRLSHYVAARVSIIDNEMFAGGGGREGEGRGWGERKKEKIAPGSDN